MADAKISITAETTQAQGEVQTLRQVIDGFFTNLGLQKEELQRFGDKFEEEFKQAGISAKYAADALNQLKPQIQELRTQQDAVAKSGGQTSNILKGLRGEMFGLYSTTQLATANLRDLQQGLSPLVDTVKQFAVETGASQDAVDLFSNSVEMLIRPTTIAKNLIENFDIAWKNFKEGAGLSTEATVKFSAEMERVNAILQEMRQNAADEAQELKDRATAIAIQVNAERSRGEITAATRAEVEKLVREYEKAGEEIPAKILRAAEAAGVLTEAQREAAKAAEESATAHGKEAAEVSKVAAEKDKLIPALTALAEGRKAATATVDDSIRALKEEIALYEQEAAAAQKAADEAQKRATDAAARIGELEGKPVLTLDEQNELNELKGQQVSLDEDAANAAENAAQATFEYGDAQAALGENTDAANESLDYASQVMAELDAATSQYSAAIQAAGDSTASTNAIVETIGENGERSFSNLADEAGRFGDVLVEVGENGEQTITNIADGADAAAAALPDAAAGLYDLADANRQLDGAQGEGGEEKGLAKMGTDAKALAKEYLPEILRLCKEIKAEAAGITLGGGGAGI